MRRGIVARPLTRHDFAPFGDVLDTDWPNRFMINAGRCERVHDLARVEAAGTDARVLISIFRGTPCAVPHVLDLIERHPFGSQAFMPLGGRPFLVVVCPDEGGRPGAPQAFVTAAGQGVNYHRGTWHGVLTPLLETQDFLVVDRGGTELNLEEHHFEEPWTVIVPPTII